MTRLRAKTIPASFIRLDATMSDADAYVNVRDLQVRAENHNKLLACRIRQPMFTQSFWDNTDARDPMIFKGLGVMPEFTADVVPPAPIFRVPIWVPPGCKSATLTGRMAYTNGSGADVNCYGMIYSAADGPSQPANTFIVTSTTHARYSGQINILPGVAAGGFAAFDFYIDGTIYGADLKTTGTIDIRDVGTDNGRPYLDADFNDTQVGNAIYIEGRLDIHPRLCVDQYSIGTAALNGTTSTRRLYLDQPFNQNPQPGTDFANSRAVQGLNLYTLSLWPNRVDDFDDNVDLP